MNESYNEILTRFTSYRRAEWMCGKDNIEKMQEHLSRLQKLAAAIEHFEKKHLNNIENAQQFATFFPNLKRNFTHRADICKRAAIRLRQTFNTLVNETAL